jgi:hypothetical protein
MLQRSTTEHGNGQTIPLSGGARAVRPWGGLWNGEREPTPALCDRVKSCQDFTSAPPG